MRVLGCCKGQPGTAIAQLEEHKRLMAKPTAVPRATGKRIEAAELSNMNWGMVKEGI